jgi:hypothetical protein
MDYAFAFSGGSPIIRKFQIGEAMANAGVPVLVGGAGNAGLALASTTAASDLMGITVDVQDTLVTAQQTDNSDPAREVSVIINPDAVYRARLSGGATSGTDLTTYTVTTASTDGLTVTAGDFNTVDLDEGTIHCIGGANVGISRKITSTSTTAATVTVAFPHDIAVGDTFIAVPYSPGEDQFVQLTSDFTQLDCSVATDTNNNNFRVIGLELNGVGDSNALIVPFDHVLAAGGSI